MSVKKICKKYYRHFYFAFSCLIFYYNKHIKSYLKFKCCQLKQNSSKGRTFSFISYRHGSINKHLIKYLNPSLCDSFHSKYEQINSIRAKLLCHFIYNLTRKPCLNGIYLCLYVRIYVWAGKQYHVRELRSA